MNFIRKHIIGLIYDIFQAIYKHLKGECND
nr:MAG TPA: hypothetical protein [Microviridae sp.]